MTQKPTKKGLQILKMIFGVLLIPVFFCTFIIDRFLMVFLVMGHGPDIVEYFADIKYIGMSILRVTMVALVTLLIMWIW